MGELRFSVLGPVRGFRDGKEIGLGSPQQVLVLAVLLSRRDRPIALEDLIDAVWDTDLIGTKTATLRTYISRLRRILDPEGDRKTGLASIPGGYILQSDCVVDLGEFERLVASAAAFRSSGNPASAAALLSEALDLWRGQPLAGLTGSWADAERERLAARRLMVLEDRIAVDIEQGQNDRLIPELTELVGAHPLRERLHGMLMLALDGSGRRGEALAVFEQIQRLLSDELGIDPGPELAGIHQRILGTEPTSAPVDDSARVPAPAQLLADTPFFTGRKNLVTELTARLATEHPSAMLVTAIRGVGGVGKTTLATHVAHRARPLYPDGQLYADLRGVDETPADPGQVLAGFLRALGIEPSQLPESLPERAALFRTVLAEKRVLVVLDNARDTNQVKDLLPGGPGCAVVVTSRSRLAGLVGAHNIDLDVLEPREAVDLLGRVAGTERVALQNPAAIDLVAATGFLPLAVRIVGSRLAARPNWTLEALVARLGNTQRLSELRAGELAVDASFSLSYSQLTTEQANAFELLAIPDVGEFGVNAAAAVLSTASLSVSPGQAEYLLESLVDLSLLESPSPGRYRYHDLVRLFARSRAGEQAGTVLGRLTGFFVATALDGYRLLTNGDATLDPIPRPECAAAALADGDAARAWFRLEWDEILRTILFSVLQKARLSPLADLLLALEPIHDGDYRYSEVAPVARAVRDAASAAGDRSVEARGSYVLAFAQVETDYQAAHEAACSSVELARICGDDLCLPLALNILGVTLSFLKRDEEALSIYEELIPMLHAAGNTFGEAQVVTNLGAILRRLGRTADAVRTCEQGLALQQSIGSFVGHALYVLAISLGDDGQIQRARATFSEAIEVLHREENSSSEGYAYARACNLEREQGCYAAMIPLAEKALELGKRQDNERLIGNALEDLTIAHHALGHTEQACSYAPEAYAVLSAREDPGAPRIAEILASYGLSPSASPS